MGLAVVALTPPERPIVGANGARALALVGLAVAYTQATSRIGWLARLVSGGGAFSEQTAIWLSTAVLVLPRGWALTTLTVLYAHIGWQRRRAVGRGHGYRVVVAWATVVIAASAVSPLLGADVSHRLLGTPADALRVWVAGVAFSLINLALLLPGMWLGAGRPPVRGLIPTRSVLGAEATTLLLAVVTAVILVRAPAFTPTALLLNAVLHRAVLTGQLRAAADVDQKTGLLNAIAWQERSAALVNRAIRSGQPITVLLIDLDHFKAINDTYGHLIGDEVLVEVARILRAQVRTEDVLGRFGGEEFVVAVSDLDIDASHQMAERIRKAVGSVVHEHVGPVTTSIGLAHLRVPSSAGDLNALLTAADRALYAAKRAGRDCVHIAPGDHDRAKRPEPVAATQLGGVRPRATLVTTSLSSAALGSAAADDLDSVLNGPGIRTVFQPIVDLDSNRLVGAEALSRGPVGQLESPAALFAAAREAGRLRELDIACQEAALTAATAAGITSPLTLFLNVEPEVADPADLSRIIRLANATGRRNVVLEVTERAIAARPAELMTSVRRLRSAGWRIALDDVGADDMSLTFMSLLQPDIIKLDLRLVQQRPGPAAAQIMHAVNSYAESAGAVLLAEGIEDASHLAVARAFGARLGQGWLFGRPAAQLDPSRTPGAITLPARPTELPAASPFDTLPHSIPLRRSTKPLLIQVSKALEREAAHLGPAAVVLATFQRAVNFTPATARRYQDLASRAGFVAAIGDGLSGNPAPGVRGADLAADDQLRGEWDLVVLSPHFSAALLARDLGDTGPDATRRFDFALTYERKTVVAAAHALLSRVTAARPELIRDIPLAA